jgi:hypothetical protein
MIVNDLDILGFSGAPLETDAPLSTDSDAVLTHSIAPQPFQPI